MCCFILHFSVLYIVYTSFMGFPDMVEEGSQDLYDAPLDLPLYCRMLASYVAI